MKKVLFTLLVAAATLQVQAQVNPKAGYIITNTNDTVYGTIDYRSDIRNAETCSFKADGAAQYTDYKPGDISGYRLTDNGIYYVTRTFPIDGEEKTIFAEYLLQGGVSLYHYKAYSTDYYYMVDATGKVAPIRETHDLYLATDERKQAQREKMQAVSQMLHQSDKAQRQLWTMTDVTSKELTQLTRDYNMEYCTDAGDCVTFQYDSQETTRLSVRLRMEGGLALLRMKPTPHSSVKEMTMTGTTPLVGAGFDIQLPRVSQALVLQAMFYYTYNSAEKESSANGIMATRKITFHDLNLQAGAMFRLMPQSRITPVVRGGLSLNYLLGYKTENLSGYYGNADTFLRKRTATVGFYGGAGVEFEVGTHRLSLTGNYIYRNYGHFDLNAPMVTFNLGFVL
ncbi:MAG: hypothetical protein IJ527_03785 [Prevotella sp.]|nr:hypothetical protein [Prevotella sp.]